MSERILEIKIELDILKYQGISFIEEPGSIQIALEAIVQGFEIRGPFDIDFEDIYVNGDGDINGCGYGYGCDYGFGDGRGRGFGFGEDAGQGDGVGFGVSDIYEFTAYCLRGFE